MCGVANDSKLVPGSTHLFIQFALNRRRHFLFIRISSVLVLAPLARRTLATLRRAISDIPCERQTRLCSNRDSQ